MADKLDIHKSQDGFEYYYNRIDKESSLSKRQKDQIKKFILEAQIGKNSKKKVGTHRLISNLQTFFKLGEYFKKDFDKLTEQDLIKFYQDLEQDKIRAKSGKPYKASSKDDTIRNLKRFLKWVWPEGKYKQRASWIKQYNEVPEMRALSMEEIKKLAKGFKLPRDKTLTMFLGDSGCRIEEALNLAIKDVEKKTKDNGQEYFIINVRISKTKPRKISVPLCSEMLNEWLQQHPNMKDKEAYLFPATYDAYRKALRLTAKKILGENVTPHQLRHSSASHYCKVINNPYKFCYRYGWAFNSDMAKRYIDREQLEEQAQEELDNVIKKDKIQEVERRNEDLQERLTNVEKVIKNLALENFSDKHKKHAEKFFKDIESKQNVPLDSEEKEYTLDKNP